MAEAFDRAHGLGARGDPAYRQAKALRDRMYRQRDVAAGAGRGRDVPNFKSLLARPFSTRFG
jgi:hypothetical protein